MHQNSGLYNTMLNRLFRPVEYDQREYIKKYYMIMGLWQRIKQSHSVFFPFNIFSSLSISICF